MNHKDYSQESEVAIKDVELDQDLMRTATIDVDNYHGFTLKIALVTLTLNLFLFTQLGSLVAAGAFARYITASVGGTSQSIWFAQIVAIVTSAFAPPISQAADYWGRKWFLVFSAVAGCVGSIIMSRATSFGMAIAGQTISAIAVGGSPLLYTVASEIVPRRFRIAAQAALNMSTGIGGVFSLLIGDLLETKYNEGWRIFWYLLIAQYGLATVMLGVLYNPPPRPLQLSLTLKVKLRQLDWLGYFLLTSGIVLFSMALSWSQNPYSWKNPHILATFIVGVILLIGLVVHQKFVKKDGLFHHDLFRINRNFTISLVSIFIEGLAFFAANGYFSFEVSVLYETQPVRIGLRFCILFFSAAVSSVLVGIWSMKYKRLREPIVLSFLLYTVFNGLMASATYGSSNAVWGYPAVLGAGLGVCLSLLVGCAQLSTPPALIAISTGLIIATRTVGGSVGLAIFNAIFNSGISKHLGPDIASAVLTLGLSPKVLPEFIGALTSNNPKALLAVPGVTPEIIGAGVKALKEAYLQSFRYIWVASGAFSLFGALIACFLINPGKELTMHVDAPLEEE